jgi:S-adenosylmethionine-diacylglycerol 3-amino-3-carboxypropyl transferase
MTMIESTAVGARIDGAVVRNTALSSTGILERVFSAAFRGLVYPQIWEDPLVDMEALKLKPTDTLVTIASGSCNVMSYLTANPAEIIAVDLSPAHVALGKLKLAAATHLPGHAAFSNMFRHANLKTNLALYDRHIRPHLDETTRKYWDGREINGRRRISRFTRGFYTTGLLGRFISAAHFLGKIYGVDPRELLRMDSVEKQREFFNERIAPVFDSRSFKTLTSLRASLFGLGIPPAQYEALAGDSADGMTGALRIRTERLACGFPLKDNYFAWQAFGRGYQPGEAASLPPYLEARNFETVRRNAGRVSIVNESITTLLAARPAASVDAFVLLDAQDWMTDAQLSGLWAEITRTARPGARVIYRTAAAPSPLPGRVPDGILDKWDYRIDDSRKMGARDRSAIYGGFHLHVKRDARP